MTREEAIEILLQRKNCMEYVTDNDDEAFDMALKALEQEPTKNDLGVDCISRQAVLDKIKEVCFSRKQEWIDFRVSQGSNGQRDLIIKFIENLPSVQLKTNVLDELRAEITTLQHRCYALTKGTMCAFCKYECEYKTESEEE